MMLEQLIQKAVSEAVEKLYGVEIKSTSVQTQKTRKDIEGDLTVVVFPFLRFSKKAPEATAEELGNYLKSEIEYIEDFSVVKGFLNLIVGDVYWKNILNDAFADKNFGLKEEKADSRLVMIEYSSPNTNKPLHLGHIRNNLLGYSLSQIMKSNGNKVVKTNIVNDRGVHICKSMYAWQKEGNGETPESSGKKGDHLVGDYYVKFDQLYKAEIKELVDNGMPEKEAKENAPCMKAVRDMLIKWEANDPKVRALWKKMNQWVYTGFDETYKNLGVDFDKIYYESDTYLEGKGEVLKGLEKGEFIKKDDGSVWADLSEEGLDQKILLRSDGTSVYMTQDIGTAKLRYEDYPIDHMVYVVGNEQNYHFQVLSILLDKLGYEWGKGLFHFSYGMVELPEGKMKSREGTVVDADDLMQEMINEARRTSEELGKLDNYSIEEKERIYRIIALGALKYFILKVDPRKTMTFNPKESIDFNGNTGPFIQYTYARIQSIIRKAEASGIKISSDFESLKLEGKEKELIKNLSRFPDIVAEAANNYSPAIIANYCYDLVKEYNQFYHDFTILGAVDDRVKNFRLVLTQTVGKVVQNGMQLLGIECPERM